MKASILLLTLSSLAASAAPDFRPLFNGTDLAGWHGDGYAVADGAIVCTPTGTNLVTDERFANYVLEFEFKLPPGGNNGLGIHYPGEGNPAYTGMELQILDNTADKYKDLQPWQFHGSVYTMVAARREGLKPVGEWNFQRVTVNGPVVKVELNGITITEANLDELVPKFPDHAGAKRRSGHLALCGHGDPVAFRGFRIAELPLAPDPAAEGFTDLLDGGLGAWKTDPQLAAHWTLHNGILRYDGKAGDLWSKESFTDFALTFDWRWPQVGPRMQRPLIAPDGNSRKGPDGKELTEEVEELDSGIYLRGNSRSQVNLWNWNVGSGEVYGYRTDGNMPPAVRAGVTPTEKADRPLGEWNRMRIMMRGERLTVVLNGRTVIEGAQLPGVPADGPIALQHHGHQVDFANIRIRKL